MAKKPIAVLISDVHYSLPTLEVADKAMRMAVAKSNELGVPLIVPGDLHDTKANLRGECVKAMIETFKLCRLSPIILRGNHDSINEKSEEHSLEFLAPYAEIISTSSVHLNKGITFIPYHHNVDDLREYLENSIHTSFIITHQGVQQTNSGHYIQDKSALMKEDLAGLRVISGHYHTRQSFDLPNGGKFDYVGNPYTLNFAEAADPTKGYQILYDDGSLEFIPTNLREHRVLDYSYETLKGEGIFLGEPQDIVWVKIRGTKEQLSKLTKKQVGLDLDISQDFRLDLIPSDIKTTKSEQAKDITNEQLLDILIDSLSNTSGERKTRLKSLWKGLV